MRTSVIFRSSHVVLRVEAENDEERKLLSCLRDKKKVSTYLHDVSSVYYSSSREVEFLEVCLETAE